MSVSGEMRAVKEELERLKAPPPKVESRPPPSGGSKGSHWTPAAVAILISGLVPVVQAWRAPNEKLDEQLKAITSKLQSAEGEIERLRALNQALKDDFSAYKTSSEKWGSYVDASLCVLGVRPPYGCPGVELLPRPMRGSGAALVQPRVEGLRPLGSGDKAE